MRSSSSISVRQLAKSAAKGGVGQCIRTTLPYIRSDVPVLIVFKALGFVVSAKWKPSQHDIIQQTGRSVRRFGHAAKTECLSGSDLHHIAPEVAHAYTNLTSRRRKALLHGLHGRRTVIKKVQSSGVQRLAGGDMPSVRAVRQADKEALAHIVYNLEGGEAGEVDAQMVEALRPSIEEAEPIGTQEMALDYIGKRGAQVPTSCSRLHRVYMHSIIYLLGA